MRFFGYFTMKLPLVTKRTTLLLLITFLNCSIQAQERTPRSQDLDSVMLEFKLLLQTSKQNHDLDGLVLAQSKLGDFYDNLGISHEAIKHYQEGLISQKKEDTHTVYLKNKMASVYLSLKKYKPAQDYLYQSLELSEALKYDKGKAMALALLGSIAEKESHFKEALSFQKESYDLFEKINDSVGMAISLENMGSVHEDLESYDVAFEYFQQAQEMASQGSSDILINIINNLGDAKRKSGSLEEALHYTQEALELAKETHNTHQEESALKDMARAYAEMGQYDLAFQFMNDHALVNEKEIERKNAEQVSTLQVLYGVKEKEAEVDLLNKENELSQVRQTVLLLLSIFIVLALLGWFVYFKKKKQQETNISRYKQKLLQTELDKKTAEEASLQREIEFKLSALTNYSLHLAHKNKMLSDVSRTLTNLKDRNQAMVKPKLEELVKEIDFDLSKDKEWVEFTRYFEQIHPRFFQNLNAKANEELSPAELRLCMLLRLNLSSKEMASILRITPDSVRIARYRMRKKLPLETKEDLQTFLVNL